MIIIEKLNSRNVAEASALADKVFSYSHVFPGEAFKASLSKEKLVEYNRKHSESIVSLEYFLAVEDTKVMGTIGLYELSEDQHEAYWVGWFCVGPEYRGKGIGSLLLEHIIAISKANHKKYLRLYTSDHPAEAAAQRLYDQKGLFIWKEKGKVPAEGYEIFYRQMALDD